MAITASCQSRTSRSLGVWERPFLAVAVLPADPAPHHRNCRIRPCGSFQEAELEFSLKLPFGQFRCNSTRDPILRFKGRNSEVIFIYPNRPTIDPGRRSEMMLASV
jgi:hypothetical protein